MCRERAAACLFCDVPREGLVTDLLAVGARASRSVSTTVLGEREPRPIVAARALNRVALIPLLGPRGALLYWKKADEDFGRAYDPHRISCRDTWGGEEVEARFHAQAHLHELIQVMERLGRGSRGSFPGRTC